MAPEAALVEETNFAPPDTPDDPVAAEKAETIAWVRRQIDAAKPVTGTPGERYLIEHRGLRPPWPASLLWSDGYQINPDASPRPCLIAVVTNSAHEIVAVQSTEVDPRTATNRCAATFPRSRERGAVFLGNPEERSATFVLGEGVESVLTRCSIGPCDAHACLGGVRFIEPRPHHKRIEILADTDAREQARRLARDYAKRDSQTVVVTVPDSLGPKADLNDALRQLGSNAVLMAVEDAERFTGEPNRCGTSHFDLEIGS